MNNETNRPANDQAPVPPSAPTTPTTEEASSSPAIDAASTAPGSSAPVVQPIPAITVSPDVKEAHPHTKNPIRAFQYLPGHAKLAVITNIVPIATATGYTVFCFYWAYIMPMGQSEDPSGMGGLIAAIAFFVMCLALGALSFFLIPLTIALATRNRVMGYVSSVLGIIGTCLAVVLLVATFAG
ncbi:hypothetical protein EYC59_04150 [Candidatus Saccharibacteria bacterium]|nr:MAG: hypothetical protein EYC59_04150 [Candidatus Saccharibacteria bacterium]